MDFTIPAAIPRIPAAAPQKTELAMITHSAQLPFGFTVEFQWQDTAMVVSWKPRPPVIRAPRQRAKFLRAYTAARTVFIEQVARTVGGRIAMVDSDGEGFAVSHVDPPTEKPTPPNSAEPWATLMPSEITRRYGVEEVHEVWFAPRSWRPGTGAIVVGLLIPECELQFILPPKGDDEGPPVMINRPRINRDVKGWTRFACGLAAEHKAALSFGCDIAAQPSSLPNGRRACSPRITPASRSSASWPVTPAMRRSAETPAGRGA